MIMDLFTVLTKLLYGNPAVAISIVFVWGILSVVLSPCHLSSIPLLIAYIGGQGRLPVKRAFFMSLMFALGLLVTIAGIGVVTAAMGKMLGDIGTLPVLITSVIFMLVGFNFLGILPSPDFLKNGTPDVKKRGLIPAFFLGLLFGVVLGPCTFGFMAPVLGVVFSSSDTNIIFSLTLLVAYALGHCLLIVFAGTFTEVVQRFLDWNKNTNVSEIIKKVCGVIIILVGVYLLFGIIKI